jgi:hypothetical protein
VRRARRGAWAAGGAIVGGGSERGRQRLAVGEAARGVAGEAAVDRRRERGGRPGRLREDPGRRPRSPDAPAAPAGSPPRTAIARSPRGSPPRRARRGRCDHRRLPRACSGLMKCAVPMRLPGSVSGPVAPPPLAIPKSVTSARPVPASSRMLSGFTSRWTMPRPCAYASAHATSRSTRVRVGGRERPAGAQPLAQRLAFHVAHHEEDEPAPLAHAVDGDDVRVREAGGGARLAQEPLPRTSDLSARCAGRTLMATSRSSWTSRAR